MSMANKSRMLALGLVFASALAALGWIWWSAVRRAGISFLPELTPAEWIVYPSAPDPNAHPNLPMATVFRRPFVLAAIPSQAELQAAGFREYDIAINGVALGAPVRRAKVWKQPDSFEVSKYLRAGENRIEVTVHNTNGPTALWLALNAGPFTLTTGEQWEASYEGAVWQRARLASKPKVAIIGSRIYGGEEPWASLRTRWPTLLLFAALSATGWLAARWWLGRAPLKPGADAPVPRRFSEALPVAGLAAVWLALFANNLAALPPSRGFDAIAHENYIQYIQARHSLPLASEGWEMFQPPLYYLIGAVLLDLPGLAARQAGGVAVLRALGLGIGIAHFAVVWAALRLLFPTERAKQLWGLATAACLPPLLYISQYVTNEGLAAALVSASIYLALRILRHDHVSWKWHAGLGLCLGAAMLTKATALLALPVIVGALVWKGLGLGDREQGTAGAVQDPGPRTPATFCWRWLGALGLSLAVCGAVCGWHYTRVGLHFGNLLVSGWNPKSGNAWWQDDGYQTGAYYLRFGEALRHPWFSGLNSFGDGVYSTLWGDGLIGGDYDMRTKRAWNYDLMAIGYWLALVPILAVLAGGVIALWRFIERPSAEWLMLLGTAFIIVFAMVQVSLVVPYYCMAKAFYGMSALIPFCAFAALGFDALMGCRPGEGQRSRLPDGSSAPGVAQPARPKLLLPPAPRSGLAPLRLFVCVAFGIWAMNSCASFWIRHSSPQALLTRALDVEDRGNHGEAAALLRRGLELEPGNTTMRAMFVMVLEGSGALAEAGAQAEIILREGPNDAVGHLARALVLEQGRQTEPALVEWQRGVELAPGNDVAWQALANLLLEQGRWEEAEKAARQGLGVAPFNPWLRLILGASLRAQAREGEAAGQLKLAFLLQPDWAEGHGLLGSVLQASGRLDEAAAEYSTAVKLHDTSASLHAKLGAVLVMQGSLDEGAAHLSRALALQPDNAEIHDQWAACLAVSRYTADALRLHPELIGALNNLAWFLASSPDARLRDGPRAVQLAERACGNTGYQQPVLIGTLAAAYAEGGQFDQAVATARKKLVTWRPPLAKPMCSAAIRSCCVCMKTTSRAVWGIKKLNGHRKRKNRRHV